MCLFGFELYSFIPKFLNIDPDSNSSISVIYRAIFVVFTVLVLLKNRIHISKIRPLIIFWILYMLRVAYEVGFYSYNLTVPQFQLWTFTIFLSVLPFIAASTFYNKKTLKVTFIVIYIMLILTNIFGLFNNESFFQGDKTDYRADANEILSTVSFGKSAAALIAFSFLLILNNSVNKKYRIIFIGAIVIALINILLAGSRGPILQLIAFILIYYIFNYKKVKVQYVFLFILLFIAFIIYFPQYNFLYKFLFERIKDTGFSSNASDNLRSLLFESGWNQFTEHPFLGDALQTRYLKLYPHNLFIESLMTMGIVGGILFLIVYLRSLISAIKILKYENFSWISALLIMNLIDLFSSGSIINSFILWPLMVLAININYNFKTKY